MNKSEELIEMMRCRRSVRKYTGKHIEDEKIDMILKAGLLSPSGKNIRPVEFIVVRDREILDKLSVSRATGSAKMLAGADVAIIVIADIDKSDMWTEDASIAMTQMHLMADALGLGSCWIQGRNRDYAEGITTDAYVRSLLHYPENYRIEATLSLGYTEEHPKAYELEQVDFTKVHMGTFESELKR